MLGAIIGDVVGSIYEFNNIRKKDFELFNGRNFLTDDSIMTLAVAEIIQKRIYNDKEKVIDTFKRWGRAYPDRGYGGKFYHWLFSDDRESYRSYGNGSAMRISPVGWYARDEEEVKELSKLVTEVTHSHPEGLKGAEVTAMCIYYARIGKSKEFIKQYVEQYYDLNFDYEDLRKNYKFNEICQKTVPQAIYCFLISKDFEDCLRTTISIGGDSDTLAAISCSIAEAYYKYIDNDLFMKVFDLLPNSINGCYAFNVINEYIIYRNYLLVNDEEITENTKLMGLTYKNDEESYIDFIHSSSLSSLSEYLVFSELDNIIGIEDDDLSKEYYYARNLSLYFNDLQVKYKRFPINILDLVNKLIHNPKEEEFIKVLDEINKEFRKISNVQLIYFSNITKALDYLQKDYEGIDEIYSYIFENRYKKKYNKVNK